MQIVDDDCSLNVEEQENCDRQNLNRKHSVSKQSNDAEEVNRGPLFYNRITMQSQQSTNKRSEESAF